MKYVKEQTVWLVNPEEYVKGAEQQVWLDYHGADMTSQGWIRLCEVTVEVDYELPSRDAMRGQAVAELEKAIVDVDAKAEHLKNQLRGRIQNLLAISHDPGEVEVVFVADEDDGIPF